MSYRNKKHQKEYDREYNQKNKGTPGYRYRRSKQKAKERHIVFILTKEEFTNISSKPCVYCKDQMLPKGHFVSKGSHLDRLDNNRGYELDNVVSCCQVCNSIRNNFLTPEETKVAVKAILKLRQKPKKKTAKKQ